MYEWIIPVLAVLFSPVTRSTSFHMFHSIIEMVSCGSAYKGMDTYLKIVLHHTKEFHGYHSHPFLKLLSLFSIISGVICVNILLFSRAKYINESIVNVYKVTLHL